MPIAGATVTLTNGNQTRSAISDGAGNYSIPNAFVGTWSVAGNRSDCGTSFRLAPPLSGNTLVLSAGSSTANIEFYTLPEKTLIIRNLAVVESNRPDFSIDFLIRQMVPANVDPGDFIKQALDTIATMTSLNGFTVTARPMIRDLVLDPWPKTAAGKLDMTRAPFRFLGITNRIDLSDGIPVNNSVGEGRFMFGLTKQNGEPLPFTLIFEYGLPATTIQDRHWWARAWQDLGALGASDQFPPEYVDALDLLTRLFTMRGMGIARTNGSALNQLRSNENALDPVWELREWRWNIDTGMLQPAPTGLTPDAIFNTTRAQELVTWLQANRPAVLNGTHDIPVPFLTGASSAATAWDLSFLLSGDPMLRRAFAINTCNGCHSSETQTEFVHVAPRESGVRSEISEFMHNDLFGDAAGNRKDLFLGIVCPSNPPG